MGTEVKAEKLRKDERILKAIDKCIDSREEQHENDRDMLAEILERAFTTMQGHDLFLREYYKGFFMIKSYYTGLKVGNTEEFDVNIIIQPPLSGSHMRSIDGEQLYMKLKWYHKDIIYSSQWCQHNSLMSTWLKQGTSGKSLYFDKDAFQRSIGSLIARVLLNVPKIDNYTIKVHKTGPPFTLCVKNQDLVEWKVNLVPVVVVNNWPRHPVRENFIRFGVPEVLQNVEDENLQWAMGFYHPERVLLESYDYIVPVIRRIEKLRDTQQWNVIPSYHIKALFMQYVIDFEDGSAVPDICRLTGIKFFIHILDELRNVCKFRDLKNHLTAERNLVDPDEGQLAYVAEQLTVMIREISDDPAKLANWLLTPEELSVYQKRLKTIGNTQGIDGRSKRRRMSEESEPTPSNDFNMTDRGSKLLPGATAVASSHRRRTERPKVQSVITIY